MAKVIWLKHEFEVVEMHATWRDLPGVYVFAGVNQHNRWQALYVGQTNSFAQRMPGHERWAEAVRAGATRVHACVVKSQAERDQLEKALIRACNPQLNTHYA